MSQIKEYLAQSLLSLLGLSLLGLWLLFQSDVVSYLLSLQSKAIFGLGWIIVILLLLLIVAILRLIHIQKKYADPFKNYSVDEKTGIAIDKKTNTRYCSSCLGNHKRYQLYQKGQDWLCTNRECKNSNPPARGYQF